jgi:hypothetical protein
VTLLTHSVYTVYLKGSHPELGRNPVTSPAPGAVAQIASFLQQHPWWSVFWDKAYGVWRVADDDPDSVLYAESADAAEVLSYMASHS